MKNTIDLNNFIQIAIIVEDIEKQPGLISLESGKTYQNSWSITISASQNKK